LGDDTDQLESKIIDRMRIEDDLDRLRREGADQRGQRFCRS